MYGDISRTTFDRTRAFSSLRQQQGRPLMDSDFNELVDILLDDAREARIDVIGPSGVPETDAGFEVTPGAGGLQIGGGRIYVDGIRVEHRPAGGAPSSFTNQPFFPGAVLPPASAPGTYLAYLDVWERPITAVQEPSIREVALGGADSTTRTQIVWQVRLLRVTDPGGTATCSSTFSEWDRLLAGPTATLEVRVSSAAATPSPCVVPETAGYTGLQNQLYRVEIHEGDFDPEASGGSTGATRTFKWSRDNAAVIAAGRRHTARDIFVDRIGPGGSDGFGPGRWVELTDNATELDGRLGLLARINSALDDLITLENTPAVNTRLADLGFFQPAEFPQARRWDSDGASAVLAGWTAIDEGIDVRFSGGTARRGDFWLIPARTAILPGTTDRRIEWPGTAALRAFGPRHHYTRLALFGFDGTTWTPRGDCRRLFSSLVDSIQFELAGGDGQLARSNHYLPAPIEVAVRRGRHAVAGARVRLSLVPSALGMLRGGLRSSAPTTTGGGTTSTSVEVQTDSNGLARAWWRLGSAPLPPQRLDAYHPDGTQQVEAMLLDSGGSPMHEAIRFTGTALDNVTLCSAGGDGQIGKPGRVLEIALRTKVSDGTRPVAGAHVHFSNLNRLLDGSPLDEWRGGSLHASSNLVRSQQWPSGSRNLEVVVRTDSEGVAQVQWALGSEVRLPVQQVRATLLDDADAPTDQKTLFTAQLAVASEIAVEPCPEIRPLLKGNYDVQHVLDQLCALSLHPVERVWWLRTGGARVPLDPGEVISAKELVGIEYRLARDIFPVKRLTGAMFIEVDVPVAPGVVHPVRLQGVLQSRSSVRRVAWVLTGAARTALTNASGIPRGTHAALARLLPTEGMGGWTRAFRLDV